MGAATRRRRPAVSMRVGSVALLCGGVSAGTLAAPLTGQTPTGSGDLVITGTTVMDGTGAGPRSGATIVVQNGRIAAVVADGSEVATAALAGASPHEIIDAAGATVIPGLIDAHVHLATDPNADGWRERTERQLAELLAGGVTGVRDMAGDVRALRPLAEAVSRGEIPGPRIDFAAIVAGPGFFADPRVASSSAGVELGTAPWMRAVTADSDIPAIVAEAAATGASGVKAYALVDPDLLARIAAAAHAHGLRVWAHSTVFTTRPSEAVAAGVDVLSHAAYLVWEGSPPTTEYERRGRGDYLAVPPDHPAVTRALEAMAGAGTLLDATASLMTRIATRDDIGDLRRDWTFEVVRRAHEAGVAIVAGTDYPAAPGSAPSIHEELAVLVEDVGLSPMDALVAATRNAARAIGIESDYGTIETGKVANLVILDADPLADIRNARRIRLVVREGVRVAPGD
ncbi:MAG: amidohydrolase family protein [Gemmatimonadota bacterium]|nr:amidohydrolase family protein [Gemmatimonadota bacterium]